jgi:long-chain acyl-CoA synthetase
MRLMGIYAKNRYEWFIADWACLLFGIVSVPLYDTLGIENLSYCLNITKITSIFVSADTAKTLLKLKDHGNLRTLVAFDKLDAETETGLHSLKLNVVYFADLLSEGSKLTHITNEHVKYKPDDCYTFSFTSGTTGPPKGAMISHKNTLAFIKGILDHSDL